MTDVQLYLAIGIPSAFFAINLLVIIWQAQGLKDSITSLKDVMLAKFEIVDERFKNVDERFKALDTKFKALDAKIDANFEIQRQMLLRVEGILDVRVKHLEERER